MLAAMVALVGIGIAVIYASGNPAGASEAQGATGYAGAWKKQLIYATAGLAAILAVNMINYRRLGPMSYWIYGLILVVLAVLLLDKVVDIPFVPVINNARRWIKLVPGYDIKIQPSEFCKLSYVLALGWYLRFRSNYRKFLGLIGPFGLTLLAMVLILPEPDLGTVMLMMPVLFCTLFVAGARVKHLLIIILLAVLVSPVIWAEMNHYQKMRISGVLLQSPRLREKVGQSKVLAKILTGRTDFDQGRWQRGSGWQLKHSKIAIASGGATGYGFRRGPYIQGPFIRYSLPERHNDFIFAIIAHQLGFWGCLGVILFYVVIVSCGVEIAWQNTDPFARLVSVGIVSMFAVEIIVNIAMTVGLMPITGLTLPLVSYGGSSLVVSMTAIGLLNNIGRSRPFSVAAKPFEKRQK